MCRVLGYEPRDGSGKGRLDHLRYPAQPATSAYQPLTEDLSRIVLGDLNPNRGLDVAWLANRRDVDVQVDGHDIVLRHLAILAMTGSGKSWTARRLIEQLAKRNYPIVIFDPHGDYARLNELKKLTDKVRCYYAEFPIFDEDAETVGEVVSALGYELSPTMQTLFDDVFKATKQFVSGDVEEMITRSSWLSDAVSNPNIAKYGVKPDMWSIANLALAAAKGIREENQSVLENLGHFWSQITNYNKINVGSLNAISMRTFRAAKALKQMADTNKKVAASRDALPKDRSELVKYGGISVVSLAGYTGDFQATIYSIIASDLFDKRVRGELGFPLLFVLEEGHNFAPAKAMTTAEKRAITVTRQIAQEGRKFGVGLILISQRPSRLDETTLSQCNSQVIMRMVNPADQNFVRRVVESLGEDDIRMLSGLDIGEAILAGQMINFPILVKMKEPESKGEREEEDAFEMLEKARIDMQEKLRR